MDKEILKGSIDILLLSLLSKGDLYGYEIAKQIKGNSQNLLNMNEGTLYPALRRLERKGYLKSYWKDADGGRRRRYYTITEKGKKELQRKLRDWNMVHRLILNVSQEASV